MWDGERKRNLDYDFGRMGIEEENARLKEENESLKTRLENCQARKDLESEGKIQALSNEVARLHAILNNDGTNSGTPTSRTPLNKKKVVPNSRQHADRKRGGQPGHAKASLSAFSEDEVTENVSHTLEVCPDCGTKLEESGERIKDEIDYEVKVIRCRKRDIILGSNGAVCLYSVSPMKYCRYGFIAICATVISSENWYFSLMICDPSA